MADFASWGRGAHHPPGRGYGYGRTKVRAQEPAEAEQGDFDFYSAQVYGRPMRRPFERESARHQPERESFRGRGPKGFQRSDARILEDVCVLLTEHPEVDASDISVTVEDGEVTLSGTIADRHQKRLAEDVAEEVFGVRDVHNRIRVGTRIREEGQPGREPAPSEDRARH